METQRAEQEPLSIRTFLDQFEKVISVLAGTVTIFGASVQPAVPAQPRDINIYIDNLKIDLQVDQLKNTEDAETLNRAMNALSAIEQHILQKQNELQMLSTDEAEIQHLKEQLDQESAKVQELKRRIEASQEAILWLDPLTNGANLETLALQTSSALLASDHAEIARFKYDVEEFLRLVHGCLIVCRPNLLQWAVNDGVLPISQLPYSTYREAFQLIKEKLPGNMSPPAKVELIGYFNYLIGIFA